MGSMWGSNVPLIGKSLTKFGKVGQLLATPCAPSPELWVYAAWKGVAKAIWSVGKPSALSPHGSPTSMSVFGKHGRTTPKTSPGPRYTWNGELIPGPEFQWPQGEGWAMWKVPVQLVRTAGWYLLVFDALATGVLAWTSQTYQYAGCPIPGYPMLAGTETDHLLFPGNTEGPASLHPVINTGVPYGGGRVFIGPNENYTAFYGVTSAPWGVAPDNPGTATGRVIVEETGQVFEGATPSPGAGGKMYSPAFARNQNSGSTGHTIRFEVHNNGPGFCIVDGSTVYCQIIPFDNLLGDP
jgi:hypothetical protein